MYGTNTAAPHDIVSYHLLESTASIHDNSPVFVFLYSSLIIAIGFTLMEREKGEKGGSG